MNENLNAPWLFVIDTEDYAGNFERELCAYITGRVGECGVGDDMAKHFTDAIKDISFEHVVDEADEHGCYRPATAYPTPGWFNDGMGGHYQLGGEKAALIAYRKTTAAYHRNSCYSGYWKEWQENPESHERYIKSGWTEEKLKKAVEESEKEAQKAEKTTKLSKYPAYQSVAISFDKKPTQEQIDLMKSRAYSFATMKEKWSRGGTRISKITGFRLIKNKIKRTAQEKAV